MTDRELWLKTLKTVGAMVGATVVFLGSVSLILLLGAGGHAPSTSETQRGSAAPSTPIEGKGSEVVPPGRIPRRGIHGEPRPAESHPGESI